MNSHRSGKSRLKIYIPEGKFRSWQEHLEEHQSNSDFFYNFSLWVRTALSVFPKPGLIPVFPLVSNGPNQIQSKKEKTIWVPDAMKQALIQKKGHFSLNAYILLALDLKVYGGSSDDGQIIQMINMRQRIDEMEIKLHRIEDQAKVKFQ